MEAARRPGDAAQTRFPRRGPGRLPAGERYWRWVWSISYSSVNAQRRAYYDLERLWKSAHKLTSEELLHPEAAHAAPAQHELEVPRAKKRAKKVAAKKAPSVRAAAKLSVRGAKAKAPARKTAAK